MKLSRVEIKRFRSILSLNLDIDTANNFISICGANNSGKTNVLKALNIFFNEECYSPIQDSPNHKYFGSRGGKSYPEITLFMVDGINEISITKKFGSNDSVAEVSGQKLQPERKNLTYEECRAIIGTFAFFFIPSINISFPELINKLIDDVYDLEYEKSRFRGLKQNLKESFENYTDGIVEILNQLADEINPTFREFNENWSVGFENTSDVYKFKDLISEDIDFFLNDKSNRSIEAKGSGLQRLGFILLHSRIIQKLKKKNVICCIDEPDVYLHQGLQKQLKQHLLSIATNNQIIITSHSPTFIDSYKLNNVFLLDLQIGDPVTYERTGKTYFPLDTTLIDLQDHNGLKKIQEYLGIQTEDFELLDAYNVLVEGESDKKYITETSNYFSIEVAKIIPVHGASKFEKYIDFYNSIYQGREFKPVLLIILDNDDAGRDEYRKLQKKVSSHTYKNVKVKLEFIPNHQGETPDIDKVLSNQIKSNFEVEDFIYPELLINYSNRVLKKKGYCTITFRQVESKIKAPAFRDKGILYNIDLVKNEKNPDNGQLIDFSTEQVKQGLSGLYNLKGNKSLSLDIIEYDKKYPTIQAYLKRIMNAKQMMR